MDVPRGRKGGYGSSESPNELRHNQILHEGTVARCGDKVSIPIDLCENVQMLTKY